MQVTMCTEVVCPFCVSPDARLCHRLFQIHAAVFPAKAVDLLNGNADS